MGFLPSPLRVDLAGGPVAEAGDRELQGAAGSWLWVWRELAAQSLAYWLGRRTDLRPPAVLRLGAVLVLIWKMGATKIRTKWIHVTSS